MTDLTLYHNPRCSKSRGALELLEARGLTPNVVRYLETPLNAVQIKALLGKLGSARASCCAPEKMNTKCFSWLTKASAKRN
jgi:arsenate reductase-like glutaredoxin family protein